jgi:hypothetical protein
MNLRRKLIALGVVLIPTALVVWPILRVRHFERSSGEIRADDTRVVVLDRMGKPWKDERCGEYLGGSPSGCAEEFLYAHPYAPLVPEYWVVDFNQDRRVINSLHLISP